MERTAGILILTGLVFFAGGLIYPEGEDPAVTQPIPFDHRLHAENGLECGDCHFRCEKNRDEDGYLDCRECEEGDTIFCPEHLACPDHRLPGLPGTEVCAACHEGDDPDGPAKAALLAAIEGGDPIPWNRVTRITGSNVHFSHRMHALIAQIPCVDCHGDVGSMERPPARPAVEVDMDWCLDCHRAQEARDGCVACHR